MSFKTYQLVFMNTINNAKYFFIVYVFKKTIDTFTYSLIVFN